MTKVHPQVESESEKKLRRLPQVFSRVLELPLPRDTDVHMYYAPDSDHFVVPRGVAGEPSVVKVRIVRLEPWGITRVVVHIGPGEPDLEDDLVYDKWRFRLPEIAIPSMTVAVAGYVNGQLVVIVPRGSLMVMTTVMRGFRGASMEVEYVVEEGSVDHVAAQALCLPSSNSACCIGSNGVIVDTSSILPIRSCTISILQPQAESCHLYLFFG